ncbi:YXWGXW repeat-containing protein [Granulicella rosea]|uniref:YXWGXW repeat-containing protein n=1 Tax=Granulicella rosea TaxID=474952 RepID=A0A239JNG9_9BACT|nr:YXWGXW repeat-containing protein [Granulicella rosea]SNT07566.1 YXWGXW repeat-containing protein [Granulicella rosea]
MKNQLLIASTAVLLAVGSAVSSQAQIVVRIGPPPPRVVETVPPPPPEHRDWAWHAGYHRWDGNRYVWVPGAYERPPHPHAVWVEGHWDHRGGGYVWREGHWR